MNLSGPFLFALLFGLTTGIGHGIISHHQNLPFLLTDQIFQSFSTSMISKK